MTPQTRRSRPSPSRPANDPPGPPENQPHSRPGNPGEDSSESSSTVSSDAEFFSDPGPDFDPEHAPAAPALEDELEHPDAQDFWTEEQIRQALVIQGNATHFILKVGPADTDTWKQTEEDLDQIAPPLTRILNRYDMTRAAAAAGDEILLGTALFSYAAKNYTRRRLLLERQASQEPAPVTGVAAPPGSGPESDEEWQRTHQPEPAIRPPALVPKGARR